MKSAEEDAGVGPVFILLFNKLPTLDPRELTEELGATEALAREVSIVVNARSKDGFVAEVAFDSHTIQLAGLDAPAPPGTLDHTVPVSRFKRDLLDPLLRHRAQVVCYYRGAHPDPAEQLIALQKVARSFLKRGLLGLLDPEAWNCMPRTLVEKITPAMLRGCLEEKPLSFWIGFIKFIQEHDVWFCTKGQHRFGFQDLAWRGDLKEAEKVYEIFENLFRQMSQSSLMPKPGDMAQVGVNEYVLFREVYELQDLLIGPAGTLVVEKTSQAEALTGGPDGSGSLVDMRQDKVVYFNDDEADMKTATSYARETLAHFWQVFSDPRNHEEGFALKVRLTDRRGTEHFWAVQIERKEEGLFGIIDNEPNVVKSIKPGDRIEIREEEITDWFYNRDGRMVGNFTGRILLRKLPPEQAAAYQQKMSEFTPLRIQCPCGQPYSFEVEPVGGRMPWPVKCPACGSEGTAAANAILGWTLGTRAATPPSRPAREPALRVSGPQLAPQPPPMLSAYRSEPPPVPGRKLSLPALLCLGCALAILPLGFLGWMIHFRRHSAGRAQSLSMPPAWPKAKLNPGSVSGTRRGSMAPAGDPKVATDPLTAAIPSSRVTGTVGGQEFICDQATLQGGSLTLAHGEGPFAALSVRIPLNLKWGEALAGRRFAIASSAVVPPAILLRWQESGVPHSQFVSGNYALRLEFGEQAGTTRIPGKIFLECSTSHRTKFAGQFEAQLK